MAANNYSVFGSIKTVIMVLFIALVAILAVPTFKATYAYIDNMAIEGLLDNLVKEGEKDKLYGVDQIYDYLQKGFDVNHIELKARDIIKAENFGSYVNLNLDYRADSRIFSSFYLSNVFNKTYRVKLK